MADTFDYAEAAADALELIAEFGLVGSIRRTVVAGGGPTDETGGTATDTDYPATLVVLPIGGPDVDGTTIKTTDVQIYVASSVTITPETTDQVVSRSDVYNIVRINALAPAGTVVMYDIVGRA